jgi:hypothetical protein
MDPDTRRVVLQWPGTVLRGCAPRIGVDVEPAFSRVLTIGVSPDDVELPTGGKIRLVATLATGQPVNAKWSSDQPALARPYSNSWVAVMGSGWIVEDNSGTHSLRNGFEVWVEIDGGGATTCSNATS